MSPPPSPVTRHTHIPKLPWWSEYVCPRQWINGFKLVQKVQRNADEDHGYRTCVLHESPVSRIALCLSKKHHQGPKDCRSWTKRRWRSQECTNTKHATGIWSSVMLHRGLLPCSRSVRPVYQSFVIVTPRLLTLSESYKCFWSHDTVARLCGQHCFSFGGTVLALDSVRLGGAKLTICVHLCLIWCVRSSVAICVLLVSKKPPIDWWRASRWRVQARGKHCFTIHVLFALYHRRLLLDLYATSSASTSNNRYLTINFYFRMNTPQNDQTPP